MLGPAKSPTQHIFRPRVRILTEFRPPVWLSSRRGAHYEALTSTSCEWSWEPRAAVECRRD